MKRRWISIICLVCILSVWLCPVPVQAQDTGNEPAQLYALSAVLMDADSGRILFGKEADEKRPMASTTKIMTCILTLEHMEEGQISEVSDYAAWQPEVHLGVRSGEKYYIRDLLYSLMLESHNDSAVIIAEGIAGSVEQFAALMNEKAEELGCRDTHFVTPNGLDGKDEEGIHSTTAADLARIMKYCIMDSPKKEEFLEITRTAGYQFSDREGKRSFSCNNHNAFLGMMEGALSGKTGFTADAGYCYVGALRREDRTFIVALLACGWPNNKGYKWKDTRTLMEYGLANYEYRNVWEDTDPGELAVKGGICDMDIYAENTVVPVGLDTELGDEEKELRVLLREDEKVEVSRELADGFTAPVEKGTHAGRVVYTLEGQEIASYEIVTLRKVEERTLFWCFQEMLRQICC